MSDTPDKKRFLGIGDHKGGLGHWSLQRITSILLIPLALLFMFSFMGALGHGHVAMLQVYQNPFNALVAILFFIITFYHLALGLEVVIDDYIPNPKSHKTIMLLSNVFCRALSLIAALSIIALQFSA